MDKNLIGKTDGAIMRKAKKQCCPRCWKKIGGAFYPDGSHSTTMGCFDESCFCHFKRNCNCSYCNCEDEEIRAGHKCENTAAYCEQEAILNPEIKITPPPDPKRFDNLKVEYNTFVMESWEKNLRREFFKICQRRYKPTQVAEWEIMADWWIDKAKDLLEEQEKRKKFKVTKLR